MLALYPTSNRQDSPSWVVIRICDGEVITELFGHHLVDALNTRRYKAVPILEYLQSLNSTN